MASNSFRCCCGRPPLLSAGVPGCGWCGELSSAVMIASLLEITQEREVGERQRLDVSANDVLRFFFVREEDPGGLLLEKAHVA